MVEEKKSSKKKVTAAVAMVLAVVIALGGTFAWQSISQQALGEAETYKNPGGRLHDDFSGWQTSAHNEGFVSKDIYVENFGSQPIFARVRLDEYMEIGAGAGLKQGEDGYFTKEAKPMDMGADIDDVTTWKTHLPVGAVAADPAASPAVTAAPANLGNDPDEELTGIPGHASFHEYWTWTMGGEDTVNNPDGKTVYMPTFNKNGDSLAPDINGTMDGKNAGDKSQYDDWVKYTKYVPAATDPVTNQTTPASGSSATRVRDEAKNSSGDYLIPNGAFYDADENTVDEGLGQGYGNGGILNTNYSVVEEIHYARETENGGVCTMAEWNELTKSQKDAHGWWVYDVDGWAYWSRPIEPYTATGLLLDRLTPTQKLLDLNVDWYYSVNAVAQFVTADDLGRKNGTGFYYVEDDEGVSTGYKAPTEEAKELLKSIGVSIVKVEGSIKLNAMAMVLKKNSSYYEIVDDTYRLVDYVMPGMPIYLGAVVTVDGELCPDAALDWSIEGLEDPDNGGIAYTGAVADEGASFTSTARTAFESVGIPITDWGVAVVGENESPGHQHAIKITARATNEAYEGLEGSLTLPVINEVLDLRIEQVTVIQYGSAGSAGSVDSIDYSLMPYTYDGLQVVRGGVGTYLSGMICDDDLTVYWAPSITPGYYTWELDDTLRTTPYVEPSSEEGIVNTAISYDVDAGAEVLTAAADETGPIYVKVTYNNTDDENDPYNGRSVTVPVEVVNGETVTVELASEELTTMTTTTAKTGGSNPSSIGYGGGGIGEGTYYPEVAETTKNAGTVNGAFMSTGYTGTLAAVLEGADPGDEWTWTWKSSDPQKVVVRGDGQTCSLEIPDPHDIGSAVVTATADNGKYTITGCYYVYATTPTMMMELYNMKQ